MSLISTASFLSLADTVGAVYEALLPVLGASTGNPVAGTTRNAGASLLSRVLALGDYQQIRDLQTAAFSASTNSSADSVVGTITGNMMAALNSHIQFNGRAVDKSISGIIGFANYYNTATPFSVLLTPGTALAYGATSKSDVPVSITMSPMIYFSLLPWLNAVNNANGLGSMNLATSSFAGGAVVDTTKYSAVKANLVVTTTVSGQSGGSPVSVVVSGIDNTGVSTTTWSASLPVINQVSAISTTITPAVTAQSKQTVAVASATGIVPGSVLTVDSGASQETVLVEVVSGSNIAAAFQKAHNAGCAITGLFNVALTPSVSGRRLVAVTNIIPTLNGATVGILKISGLQDRVGI